VSVKIIDGGAGMGTAPLLVEDLLNGLPQIFLVRVADRLGGEPELTRLVMREALRLLTLLSIGCSGPGAAISTSLDEAWHSLILETSVYHAICSRLPGGQFIHHTAIGDFVTGLDHEADGTAEGVRSTAEAKNASEVVLDVLSAYVGVFGPFEEAIVPFWAGIPDLMKVFSLDLPTLNERLAQIHAAGFEAHSADDLVHVRQSLRR